MKLSQDGHIFGTVARTGVRRVRRNQTTLRSSSFRRFIGDSFNFVGFERLMDVFENCCAVHAVS